MSAPLNAIQIPNTSALLAGVGLALLAVLILTSIPRGAAKAKKARGKKRVAANDNVADDRFAHPMGPTGDDHPTWADDIPTDGTDEDSAGDTPIADAPATPTVPQASEVEVAHHDVDAADPTPTDTATGAVAAPSTSDHQQDLEPSPAVDHQPTPAAAGTAPRSPLFSPATIAAALAAANPPDTHQVAHTDGALADTPPAHPWVPLPDDYDIADADHDDWRRHAPDHDDAPEHQQADPAGTLTVDEAPAPAPSHEAPGNHDDPSDAGQHTPFIPLTPDDEQSPRSERRRWFRRRTRTTPDAATDTTTIDTPPTDVPELTGDVAGTPAEMAPTPTAAPDLGPVSDPAHYDDPDASHSAAPVDTDSDIDQDSAPEPAAPQRQPFWKRWRRRHTDLEHADHSVDSAPDLGPAVPEEPELPTPTPDVVAPAVPATEVEPAPAPTAAPDLGPVAFADPDALDVALSSQDSDEDDAPPPARRRPFGRRRAARHDATTTTPAPLEEEPVWAEPDLGPVATPDAIDAFESFDTAAHDATAEPESDTSADYSTAPTAAPEVEFVDAADYTPLLAPDAPGGSSPRMSLRAKLAAAQARRRAKRLGYAHDTDIEPVRKDPEPDEVDETVDEEAEVEATAPVDPSMWGVATEFDPDDAPTGLAADFQLSRRAVRESERAARRAGRTEPRADDAEPEERPVTHDTVDWEGLGLPEPVPAPEAVPARPWA